jgi:hypothetical protein
VQTPMIAPTWNMGANLSYQCTRRIALTAGASLSCFNGGDLLENHSEFPTKNSPTIPTNAAIYTVNIGVKYSFKTEPKKDSTQSHKITNFFEPTLAYPTIHTHLAKDTLNLAFNNVYSGGSNYTFSFKEHSATKADGKATKQESHQLKGFEQNGNTILQLPLRNYQIKEKTPYLLTITDSKKVFYFLFYYK